MSACRSFIFTSSSPIAREIASLILTRPKSALSITEEDLGEALTAAHAIGDDTLGHADKTQFTHGSSEQRIRWFRRGFDGGDARNCDTFAVPSYTRL